MGNLNAEMQFFLSLAKIHTVMNRKFDAKLGGLGLSEFIILLHLSKSEDEKLRRIDLAEKVGLTPSGVTRILLPMEKIGLVGRQINEQDARVSFVTLAPGWKTKLTEAIERAELFSQEIIPEAIAEKMGEHMEFLQEIEKRV